MADLWKAPDHEDVDASGPAEKFDRYARQSTLSDLVRPTDPEAVEPLAVKERKGPLAGHEALAALAAEVAQSTLAPPIGGPDTRGPNAPVPTETGQRRPAPSPFGGPSTLDPRPRVLGGSNDNPEAKRRQVGAPSASPDATPRQLGAPSASPDARPRQLGPPQSSDPGASSPAPARKPTPLGAPLSALHPAGAVRPGSGEAGPGLASLPAAMRLQAPAGPSASVAQPTMATAAPAAAIEQTTIPLRRRPTADGPASISAGPGVPGHESAIAATPQALRVPVVVEAWSPGEDDILPRHAVRRGRSFRRGR